MSEQSATSGGIAEGHTPAARISMPAFVDWHMILDRELDQLTQPQSGLLGSLGFVGLGAVLGLIGSFVAALEKLATIPAAPVSKADISNLLAFPACIVLTAICLLLAFLSWRRNSCLADEIRKRPKHASF
ncbi:hypothetical protein [Bradyrhizobium sp. 169]|uniref:hypothetical protein n=1 Tax=Bradyrhizobium sp. 169 TaxID=2782640 RepID=UPI001FF736FD|nr:hypothetical protein [Bradyrhizobium sp. 169]MCK1592143.1 hypothetical protein [Bradyrhizobium sp. 169]